MGDKEAINVEEVTDSSQGGAMEAMVEEFDITTEAGSIENSESTTTNERKQRRRFDSSLMMAILDELALDGDTHPYSHNKETRRRKATWEAIAEG